MTKRKKSFITIFIIISLLVIFVLLFQASIVVFPRLRPRFTPQPTAEPVYDIVEPTQAPAPSPEPEDITITISAVGDAMAHESQLIHDYNKDPDIYDFMPSFTHIKPTIQKSDFAFANLETTISGESFPYTGYPRFNTPISYAEALQDCGFDLVTLANNHALDMGEVGVKNTLENLEKIGMDNTGISLNEEDYSEYYITDIKGIKTAIIAYSYNVSRVRKFENPDFVQRYWGDIELVEADIKKVRELGAEVVILSVHWGEEYRRSYSTKQKKLAEQYIALGADVVIGSHPHVVQPLERITVDMPDGSTKEGIVAFSLGNFISNQKARYKYAGIVVNINITKTPEGKIILEPVTYVPTLIRCTRIYNVEASDHKVLPAGKFINDPELFGSLSEYDQERLMLAYDDIVELIDPADAVPLDE